MSVQAGLIAEDDVEVIAKYFASLEGLETTRSE
jgi:hypothetical protein